MVRPNLLLCFDAFGTLFRPKGPVASQYAEVARKCGLTGLSDDEVQSTLSVAIKSELKQNPNYGKATGLGASKWWTKVIHNTFNPLLKQGQLLPKDLGPKLLHRFSSKEAYTEEPGLNTFLKALKHQNMQRRYNKIVVGVITNSDDRVPDILSSFGVKVSPLRYGTEVDPSILADQKYDIDFHCISYDVGVEKPDRPIFDAAELMLIQILAARDKKSPAESKVEAESWQKLYVGDEYVKDVVGSSEAGWHPVLLDPQQKSKKIRDLENDCTETIDELFKEHAVLRVRSIQALANWLIGGKQK